MSAVNGTKERESGRRRRSRYEGIVVRHSRGCRSRQGGRCSCRPSFQAQVWSAREQKTIRRSFRELGEARAWRQQSLIAVRNGLLRSPSQTTLNDAAADWLEAAEAGLVRTRSGETYKPSAVRAYRQALNHRALPHLGSKRLTSITHLMLQDFADQLSAQGLSPSSVRNTLLPLRAIFRRADSRGEVAINPTLPLPLLSRLSGSPALARVPAVRRVRAVAPKNRQTGGAGSRIRLILLTSIVRQAPVAVDPLAVRQLTAAALAARLGLCLPGSCGFPARSVASRVGSWKRLRSR
jgi:hypothetical protein